MKRKLICGFSQIELMAALTIVGALTAAAVPSYDQYLTKSAYSKIINAAIPYKSAVAACLSKLDVSPDQLPIRTSNGEKLDCAAGHSGVPIPPDFDVAVDKIKAINISSAGIITIIPAKTMGHGIKEQHTYVLTPHYSPAKAGQLSKDITWTVSGGGVDAGWSS